MMDYRARSNAYRRQTRGSYGGLGGLIWLIMIASLAVTHLWQLALLVFFALPFFFLVLRPILFSTANARNRQQYSQPQQEQPFFQEPFHPSQPEQLDSQPYSQGYGAQRPPMQRSEISQEGGEQDQYPAQQTQQYEEPITMYPQE
jgi:hypothetical protein